MSDATANLTETIDAGGFRIEIRPDELTVTPAQRGKEQLAHSFLKVAFIVPSLAYYALWLLFLLLPADICGAAAKILVSVAFAVILFLFACSVRRDHLHCTRESLEVIRSQDGREGRTKVFAKDDIRRIRFGDVAPTFWGLPSSGLIFSTNGRKAKALEDLSCVEAQCILKELERLGYDVEKDVGMPMMIQMELERRNASLPK